MIIKTFAKIAATLSSVVFAANLYAIPVAGGSSGTFINPVGPGGMVVSGVGTSSFSWGDGSAFGSPSSSLSYTGNLFSGETGDVFSFGSLNYYNGTIALGTEASQVDLDVLLTFTNPMGIAQDFLYTMSFINTPNTSDPMASADIVNLPGSHPDSYFTVDGIHYTLEFLGFGAITGSGFTTVDQFHVLEGAAASAQMLGRITYATNVPEPSSMALVGLGLLALSLSRKKSAA